MVSHTAAPEGASVVLACCSLNLLRCLVGMQARVVLAECDPESLTLQSRHARNVQMIACPRTRPEQAVEDLIALGQRYRDRPMLAFDNEAMLLLASRHRDVLSRYYRFLLPSSELVEDLTCKLRFADLAERLSLPVPRSFTPAAHTTAEEIAERIGFPCVLKPNSHTGRFTLAVEQDHRFAYKVLYAATLEQLRQQYQKMRLYCDSFLVQQYVPGDDRTLYSFHVYLDRDGGPLGFFVGRKVRTNPRGSGGSTYLELVYEPEVVRLGMQAMRKMHAVGPMKIDFKRDPVHNRWYVLECNARFTLWNYLGMASGVNLPATALADLYERPITPPTPYRTNVRWLSFSDDLRAFVREYRPAGEWTWGQWLWSLKSRKVHDVFAWSDPKPLMVSMARYIRLNYRKLQRRMSRQRGGATVALPVPSGGPMARPATAPAPVPATAAMSAVSAVTAVAERNHA